MSSYSTSPRHRSEFDNADKSTDEEDKDADLDDAQGSDEGIWFRLFFCEI